MENWVIAVKLIVLLYSIVRYTLGDMSNIPYVVLSVLTYIIINMLCYVLKGRVWKRLMLVSACAVLSISAYYLNPVFILLLPVNIIELIGSFSENALLWGGAALIPVLFCDAGIWPEYLLIGLFGFMVITLSRKLFFSIKALKDENDRLREKNDLLRGRLDMGSEYENQVRYLSQLEERNSLAQKIHDRVGHTIAGSLIQLEAAEMIIGDDVNKARKILRNVTNHLQDGMEEIRNTLRNIKPAQEQLGINRLKVVLDEFSMNNPIKAGFTFKGGLDVISHMQWKLIMDNIKEALTNTLKYAKASTVNVDINVMNRLIRVEVKDNGIGAYSFKKGLGISGMEERMENAGGKLIIDGSMGFSIIMLLPVIEKWEVRSGK